MKVFISRFLCGFFQILIIIYRYVVSPFFLPSCRFYPTCSQYASEALKTHGPFKGFRMICSRLSRCHPWGGKGIDLVPIQEQSIKEWKE